MARGRTHAVSGGEDDGAMTLRRVGRLCAFGSVGAGGGVLGLRIGWVRTSTACCLGVVVVGVFGLGWDPADGCMFLLPDCAAREAERRRPSLVARMGSSTMS